MKCKRDFFFYEYDRREYTKVNSKSKIGAKWDWLQISTSPLLHSLFYLLRI
ncbi:hypothetical protein V6Z12_A12G246400 [Gossypium hirsutum]